MDRVAKASKRSTRSRTRSALAEVALAAAAVTVALSVHSATTVPSWQATSAPVIRSLSADVTQIESSPLLSDVPQATSAHLRLDLSVARRLPSPPGAAQKRQWQLALRQLSQVGTLLSSRFAPGSEAIIGSDLSASEQELAGLQPPPG